MSEENLNEEDVGQFRFLDSKDRPHDMLIHAPRGVLKALRRFMQYEVRYEDALRFVAYDRLAKMFIKRFEDRVEALLDPQILIDAVSRRIMEVPVSELKDLAKRIFELEKLLGVEILRQLDPEAFLTIVEYL